MKQVTLYKFGWEVWAIYTHTELPDYANPVVVSVSNEIFEIIKNWNIIEATKELNNLHDKHYVEPLNWIA
jgi:hypothetical protein